MARTAVGYAGGDKVDPTYHALGNHAEVVQIEFDPRTASLADLLDRFWAGHDPGRRDRGGQYRAILLCEETQRAEVERSAARVEASSGRPVETEIAVGRPFFPAEAYHQKWKLRQRRELFADLARNYASEADVLRSVAATKLNALVAGHLDAAQIQRHLGRFGLSPAGIAALRDFVPRRLRV